MEIGRRIREVRKAQGLSQEELARRAGVSLNIVNRLERGVVTDPHLSTVADITNALGMSIGDLQEEPELVGPKDEAREETGPPPPRVSRERLQEHFENVRQGEVDYLNDMVLADLWRLALPGEKPRAHFVPDDIDTDRIWEYLEHALSAGNVFEPEEAERLDRGRKKAVVG